MKNLFKTLLIISFGSAVVALGLHDLEKAGYWKRKSRASKVTANGDLIKSLSGQVDPLEVAEKNKNPETIRAKLSDFLFEGEKRVNSTVNKINNLVGLDKAEENQEAKDKEEMLANQQPPPKRQGLANLIGNLAEKMADSKPDNKDAALKKEPLEDTLKNSDKENISKKLDQNTNPKRESR